MEQVLADVLELENQAKAIVKQQTDRREALPAEVEKKLSEMREKYSAEAEKRLDDIRAEEQKHLEAELAKVNEEHDRQMKRLTDVAERESENFARQIFERVIGTEMD